MLRGIVLALAFLMAKFFYDEREKSMIKWQYDRSNRMFIFWSIYTLVQILLITSSYSGNIYIYRTISVASQTLSLIYLYMIVSELFGI